MQNTLHTEKTSYEIWTKLCEIYKIYNASTPNKWENDFYLEQISASCAANDAWESTEGSLMIVTNDKLIFSSWEGTPAGDLNFLLDVLDMYPALKVVPLGKYFHDLIFLMNTKSICKYQSLKVSAINLDIQKYNSNALREYKA